MRAPLGITLGDVNGIGPEITLAALRDASVAGLRTRFVIVGSSAAVAAGARMAGTPPPPVWEPGRAWPGAARVAQWSPATDGRRPLIRPGRLSASAGRAAGLWLQAAVDAIGRGDLAGMVTAPVCKRSLHLAGWRVPGQTEWLGAMSGARRVGMLLVGGRLRVALVTRHLPLARVPGAVTAAAIAETVELLSGGLEWLGTANRCIGVCALNPHAGDGGICGREDERIVRPAVRRLRRRGLEVEGPVPADTIFHLARCGRYGAIAAMYHDQGLAPLKMAAFNRGVNLTLGLPFVRTSPDHGTGFDIAGTGRAHPGSMIQAIRMADRLARRPNPWSVRTGTGAK